MLRKLIQALAIALAATLLCTVAWWRGTFDAWEGATWSARVRVFAKPSAFTDRIKLIMLDQGSLEWAKKEMDLGWPWMRQAYSPIVEFCRLSGAKVLGMDMIFSETSLSGGEDDETFGGVLAQSNDVVMSFFMGAQSADVPSWPAGIPAPRWTLDASAAGHLATNLVEDHATFPVLPIATNAAMLANVKWKPDSDGVYRRVVPLRLLAGHPVPLLGLATYLNTVPVSDRTAVLSGGELKIGSRTIPLDASGQALLRFRGPQGTHQRFSAGEIIQSVARLQKGEKPNVSTNALRGCYVLMGSTAPALEDLKASPMSQSYPGVELHATFLDNLLAGDFAWELSSSSVAIMAGLLSLLAAFAVLLCRKAWETTAVLVACLVVPVALAFAAYPAGLAWPLVYSEFTVGLALASATILNYATEGRQRRFVKSAFNQYVGADVLDELVLHPEKLTLGGEKRELTMFFSDIEKFSSFSEKLDPPRLIELLNVYLTEMGAILREEGAYVDKFVGDAIVAFWNAPIRQEDHAARAVRATLRCQRRCAELRAEWAERFGPVVKTRIGLNTGEVVVGNMGSRDKFNYTMLGDAANAASRLEGANKAFGTYIMVAEPTWHAAKGAVLGRELGLITVVGRKSALRVFEPIALAGESLPGWVAEYERGLAAVRAGAWSEALAIFAAIPDEPASRIYAARCKDLVEGRMPAWDGVWNLTEK